MNKDIPLRVGGVVFALVALLHLLRVIYQTQILVSGSVLPMAVSYIGLVITLILSIWMFVASRK